MSKKKAKAYTPSPIEKVHQAERQIEHDTLVRAVRNMITAEFEGDYMSGVEFLAAVLVEHAGERHIAQDALNDVSIVGEDRS